MAGRVDIAIKQGDSFTHTITVTDANDVPVSQTGFTFRSQIRRAGPQVLSPAQEVFAEFTVGDVNEPSTGQVVFTLLPSLTQKIPPGKHWYDIQRTATAGGAVLTLVEGDVTVVPDVTFGPQGPVS